METYLDIPDIDCLKRTTLVRDVVPVERGHVQIETGFKYPDGSSIDIYVKNHNKLLWPAELTLTDFGNTISWIGFLGVDPFKNKKRNRIFQSIIEIYDVNESGACLECKVNTDELANGLIRLAQACLRVADLGYMARFAPKSQFMEEVEEVLDETGLDYDRSFEIDGRAGNVVKVDFRVHGPRTDSALMLLPAETSHETTARQRAEHVFATFFDLQSWPGQRIAVLDDRRQIYPDADISRIESTAIIIPFTERESFSDILLAA
jgi:hypothetical protein